MIGKEVLCRENYSGKLFSATILDKLLTHKYVKSDIGEIGSPNVAVVTHMYLVKRITGTIELIEPEIIKEITK